MKFLLRPLAERYREWMMNWENDLCFRATDRIARPFEYGLEWSAGWPGARDFSMNGSGPASYLTEINERAIATSDAFYGYEKPQDFRLIEKGLEFASPVRTPHAE